MKRTSGLDLQGTGASKANIRASMVVASCLHLRFDIPGISLRVVAFSSGSRVDPGASGSVTRKCVHRCFTPEMETA